MAELAERDYLVKYVIVSVYVLLILFIEKMLYRSNFVSSVIKYY